MLILICSQFLEKQRRNLEKQNKSVELESSTPLPPSSTESERSQEVERQLSTNSTQEQPEPTLRRRLALEAAERRQREQGNMIT